MEKRGRRGKKPGKDKELVSEFYDVWEENNLQAWEGIGWIGTIVWAVGGFILGSIV